MKLKTLVGSGEMIGLLTLPFLVIGLALNALIPGLFAVGGPPTGLQALAVAMLIPGVTLWLWSVVLILTEVPKGHLITTGPYAVVKHPLYTSVGLLVLPAVGLLLNSWLGALIGSVVYVGSRLFSAAEEETLHRTFGARWDEYSSEVMIPWL